VASERTVQRVGVLDFTSSGWAAGSTFTRALTCSLVSVCLEEGVEVFILSDKAESPIGKDLPVTVLQVESPLLGPPAKAPSFCGESLLRRALGLSDPSNTYNAYVVAREHGISVLLPPGAVPCWAAGVKTVGWIPDFQHVYLPEFFPREERRKRDEAFRSLVERADLVLLSSRTALDHFAAFAPDYGHKARVAPFPSIFAFEPPSGDPRGSPCKYNLPEKFALVANQFWAHKNHEVVVEALDRLRRKGVRVTVVMTGLLADSRDPSNHALSRLLQAVACGGLAGQVTLLGQVPRKDLVDLMRVAVIVIQPSRFEGWSTVVQDAKALGRPVVCSDIPVHREQAPEAIGFFPCDRPDILADLLAACWDALEPGPDRVGEERALAAEREFAGLHGRTLLGICREAVRT